MNQLERDIIKAVLGRDLPENMFIPNFVNKIKQAFIDAGWRDLSSVLLDKNGKPKTIYHDAFVESRDE
jgi:hypothetical protein